MSILSRHEYSIRVALALLGVFGGIFVNPFVVLASILLLSIAYASYEALALGLFMDLMWQPVGFMHPVPLFTLAAIALIWLFEPVRSQLLS